MSIYLWYVVLGPVVCFPILFHIVRKQMDIGIGTLMMIIIGAILPFCNIGMVLYLMDWKFADKVVFKKAE